MGLGRDTFFIKDLTASDLSVVMQGIKKKPILDQNLSNIVIEHIGWGHELAKGGNYVFHKLIGNFWVYFDDT